MTVWSCLRPIIQRGLVNNVKTIVPYRGMSGDHGPRMFPIKPTRWQWTKFKDLLHFYTMLGLIPVTAVIMYSNIFVGPATLQEIPEGYTPKHWEYHSHPITRFLSKHVFHNPQQEYEKYLHYIYEEDEKKRIRELEKKIKEKMSERKDYQAYYYRPVMAKYYRKSKEAAEYLETVQGD